MNELVPVFGTSLFDTSIADIGLDFLELGIDSVLQDGLLKDIPIVGTIVGVGKFAQNVHDRNLLRQTLAFIKEFNSGRISSKKIKKHQAKLLRNPKLMEKELGRILILLDKNLEIVKSVFEAKFYSAYVDSQISWNEFCELCDVTDRLFFSDLDNLKEAYTNNGVTKQMPISYKHDRLISVGLLTNETRLSGGFIVDFGSNEPKNIINLTDIGKMFWSL